MSPSLWNNFISTQSADGVRVLSQINLLPIEGVVLLQFLFSVSGPRQWIDLKEPNSQVFWETLQKVHSQKPKSRISLERPPVNGNSQSCLKMHKCHLQLHHSVTRDHLVPVSLHMMLNVPIPTLELVTGSHEVHRQADIAVRRLSCKVGVTGPSNREMNNIELQSAESQ